MWQHYDYEDYVNDDDDDHTPIGNAMQWTLLQNIGVEHMVDPY